jgi:hypothetical protein
MTAQWEYKDRTQEGHGKRQQTTRTSIAMQYLSSRREFHVITPQNTPFVRQSLDACERRII